jgi:hypothetical protein
VGVRFARISDVNSQPGSSGSLTLAQTVLSGQFWVYRFSGYLLLNVIEDPVWLALVFC